MFIQRIWKKESLIAQWIAQSSAHGMNHSQQIIGVFYDAIFVSFPKIERITESRTKCLTGCAVILWETWIVDGIRRYVVDFKLMVQASKTAASKSA